jgi:Right handed beta helix region
MKKHLLFPVLAAGLTLLSVAGAKAFETAQGVTATPITSLPFTIATSGNYYLPANLVFTSPAGAAIVITASEVYLDLNGRTLSSNVGTGFNVGVFVFNQIDVTIQNGDIDGFFYGVYFAPDTKDNNAKNVVDNVRFNGDGIGVISVSGQSNWVKNCIIDGGDIGIYFFADLGGSRASNNILEAQQATERIGAGIALVSQSSGGTVFDNNVVSKGGSSVGMFMSGTDKYRFDSFVGFPINSPHAGGTNEFADSL